MTKRKGLGERGSNMQVVLEVLVYSRLKNKRNIENFKG